MGPKVVFAAPVMLWYDPCFHSEVLFLHWTPAMLSRPESLHLLSVCSVSLPHATVSQYHSSPAWDESNNFFTACSLAFSTLKLA